MINTKLKTEYRTENSSVLDDLGIEANDIKNSTTKIGTEGGGAGTGTKTPEEIAKEEEVKKANELAASTKLATDLEIAKKFGGTKLDDKGNAVDDTGKVIKTAEDIKTESESGGGGGTQAPEAVEVDGVKYKLDKDGNALGTDGKVFKTKAELDALEIADTPLVTELITKSGYQPKDENGKPIEYEDSIEGLIKYNKDVAFHLANEEKKKLFSAYPDVEDYLQHRLRGGDPKEYFQKQNDAWIGVKLDTADEGMLTKAVVDNLMKTGMPRKDAEETAKLYKDTNKLKEFGENAYKTLVKAEKDIKEAGDKEYQAALVKNQQDTQKYWEQRNEIVKKGKLHSISIPEADKESFFKFISAAVDEDGNSQAAYKRSELTPEQSLELDYLLFKGMNLSTLVSLAASKQNADGLRKRFTTRQKGAGGGAGTGHEENNPNPNSKNITIDNII